MLEQRNPKQKFHINLLKEWKTKEVPPQQQIFVKTVKEEDDVVGEFTPTSHSLSLLISLISH